MKKINSVAAYTLQINIYHIFIVHNETVLLLSSEKSLFYCSYIYSYDISVIESFQKIVDSNSFNIKSFSS